jgi:asparagine synthase (glutamine-hydrolysing)
MCGLVGTASAGARPDRTWLPTACEALSHRGPDDSGEWWSADGRVGLAHRRLSILDLSPAGHQPMHLADRGLSIVFNGEIYNFPELRRELEGMGHQFRSHTDTEVLLAAYAAWGTDCLQRLNGMFAFGLFDAARMTLFLARDRAGEKPLFYHLASGTLCFASELKALMANPALPRRIEPTALDCYLAMGYVPGDRCILQGFNKLPAAHALTFDLEAGAATVWRYWQLPELDTAAAAGQADEAALLYELETLLEDAVGRQLVADVPVGVLLSGGVDSSLITALAVRRSQRVRTFSISFPSHAEADESAHARLIADHFGTEHTELVAEPSTAALIPRLARQFDEPLVDSSMVPTWLVSNLVRQHCTVALGGDGGDELFGGYGHHSRLLWMQDRPGRLPLSLRRAVSWSATTLMPVGFKGRNWLQALGTDLSRDLPLVASYFDAGARRRLLGGSVADPSAEDVFSWRVPAAPDLVQRATRMDFGNYMAEDILVKIDRASMSNSLELRSPFLDHRVIEFAFSRVPSSLKTTPWARKIILKRLCERLLPPEFDKQRKQGFGIPIASWLAEGPFRKLFWDVLSDANALFDRRALSSLLAGQDRGYGNGERLFALVQFELWRREYGICL